MKNVRKAFFDEVKSIIGSEQPILRTEIKAHPELPGHIMCMYTDTVKLKPIFQAIEEKVYKEAYRLNLEISFELPQRYSGQPPESISPEKRYCSVAVYDKQGLIEPIVIKE